MNKMQTKKPLAAAYFASVKGLCYEELCKDDAHRIKKIRNTLEEIDNG